MLRVIVQCYFQHQKHETMKMGSCFVLQARIKIIHRPILYS